MHRGHFWFMWCPFIFVFIFFHDDVIKWKHFPRNWPFVRGIHRSTVNYPLKGQWRGALMFSLICVWINDWVNNREAGDLRRYRAHFDVTVMLNSSLLNKSLHLHLLLYAGITLQLQDCNSIGLATSWSTCMGRFCLWFLGSNYIFIIPPATKLGGYIGFTLSVRPSVCLSVCLSVCPLTFRVRPVASTVHDGFFPYLVQMINSMRGRVAVLGGFFPYLAQMITSMRGYVVYNDHWPWPKSSRSFDLDLENRVRSVASTVPDGFFPYLVQMITSMKRCVACDDLWPWLISSRSFDLDLESRVRSVASTVLDGFF